MRRKAEFWLGLWTLCFIAATGALAYFSPLSPRSSGVPPIALRVIDQEGRLRIDWNKDNELIRSAGGATLEVEDGGVTNRYPVEPKTLRSGGFDYIRKTTDVLMTLTLFHDGKPGAIAKVRSIGPLQAAAAPQNDTPRRNQRSRARRR